MRDFIVIGAGSAGCVMAAELARRGAGSVLVLEAGPPETHPLVSMPFGLVWLLGGPRDWRYRTVPQEAAGGREIAVPRGRMVGGSGSINSMVWFRGSDRDFDAWDVPGWSAAEVAPAFEAVEAELRPVRLREAHPLSRGLASIFDDPHPHPDRESAGLFAHNMDRHRRRSAARAYLRARPDVEVRTGAEVDRLLWSGDRASGVALADGTEVRAAKGVVLCAGSIGSPAILMRSGVGPRGDLAALGIDSRIDAPAVGRNLHDHPGVGLHFEAAGSGYGLERAQWPRWAVAPVAYGLLRRGPLASPTCEAGAFFNARGEDAPPDVQTHFIPFFLAHEGPRYQRKAGYFADVCLCRPASRGSLRLTSRDPAAPPAIDLGLFREEGDLETMAAGVERLRTLLRRADFGPRRAPEVFPGESVTGEALRAHIRNHAGTAYHPAGTLSMGAEGPVGARLSVKGARGLWAADASVMPMLTSANTNAPSMMIGWRGADFIAQDAA
ncbi:GMC family oxidoreductase N-terminal domain-containing protein [Roseibacterium sp. SDUM158017]|uniref:GMC family oxidoreductase n=1 Tax=Roseicyclus salinarum TaxID=3036773 RepID=UPI0024155745|nr:GMC family oxidoreductase N-terminal domain-containing protein [Roseibacterium sp. SDUM158017]MDG4649670.1 GMC family oxidoreductase N-terminal domain-containing protein [Roseibacterium sp. SDUM158017]